MLSRWRYDISKAGQLLDSLAFNQTLQTQTLLRSLTEAVIFDPLTGSVEAGFTATPGTDFEPPPFDATELATGW